MGRYTDPVALYRAQKAFFDRFPNSIREMHKQLAERGKDDHFSLTSGKVTTKQLRALGHPFGRRPSGRKRGRTPNLPINVQTGKLRRALIMNMLWRNSRGQSYGVFFKVPYAKYILARGGTGKMIARQFQKEIKMRWGVGNKALIDSIRRRQSRRT